MRIELEHYEKIEGEPLELDGKANKLSQMIRANLPAAMQGLVVVPLFAGYDRRRQLGRLWKFDVTGGRYEETDFEATGSGGLYARESIKKAHARGLARDGGARDRRRGAGGRGGRGPRAPAASTSLRGIFPIVNFCSDARASSDVADAEIEQVYAADPGARDREGCGAMSMPVLRLARTGDAGQGRVRPQGHRPRPSSVTLEYRRAASC